MIKNVLTSLYRIEIYPMIALIFFSVFFIGMLIWAFRQNKGHLIEMGRIPLDENEWPEENSR
ncbi:MAG: cytochrome c oxidase cbb3-type subunit 4 [Candidatus Omnitrophota bacterium]|jgi:cytochrome c oxidase cbb3-type subunit IV